MTKPKPKPWPTEIVAMVGLAVGLFLWWSEYDPAAGLVQNPGAILGPAVFGMFVADMRNRWKKVGPYDPEIIERNRRGVL